MGDSSQRRIVLVGHANVGKSVIFNYLTGSYVTVSNYPGTTVDVTRGTVSSARGEYEVVDAPGINGLLPRSEDELITRRILWEEPVDVMIQVSDAKNLEKTLELTLQLAETDIPMLLVLNLMDEALSRGIIVDTSALSSLLGIPVLPTIATEHKGLGAIIPALDEASRARIKVDYGADLEEAARRIMSVLPRDFPHRRSSAMMMLCSDRTLEENLPEEVRAEIEAVRKEFSAASAEPACLLMGRRRNETAEELASQVSTKEASCMVEKTLAGRLGELTTHPLWGIPILLLVLLLIYYMVGILGAGVIVDYLTGTVIGDTSSGWILPRVEWVLRRILPEGTTGTFLHDMLTGDFGLLSMGLTYAFGIVFPIVTLFFLTFGLLEDSGYLPRLAMLSDRLFKKIGLSGKAVLPMMLGLGCGTMAVLTTRILDTRRERTIAVLLLALAVPCSAQLGIILGLLAALSIKATLLFCAVIATQLLLVGAAANRLLPGKPPEFITELPPFRVPSLKPLLLKTWYRAYWFVQEAVPVFLGSTFLLFLLDKLKVLSRLEDAAAPMMRTLLDLPPTMARIFIMGFFRRDYSAAGIYELARKGNLSPPQQLVALVVITLFIPCIAQFMVMLKEQGVGRTLLISSFVLVYAFAVGSVLSFILNSTGFGMWL